MAEEAALDPSDFVLGQAVSPCCGATVARARTDAWSERYGLSLPPFWCTSCKEFV